MSILVLDYETTGTDPRTARPVSVALLRHDPAGDHQVLVDLKLDPQIPIPAEASAVHGITDADVAGCPTWLESAPRLAEAMAGAKAVVAHNVLYDAPILLRTCQIAEVPVPPVRWLCTLTWARSLWWGRTGITPFPKGGDPENPEKRTLDLGSLCRFFGVELVAHDAVGDARAVCQILGPLKALCAKQPRMAPHFSGTLAQLERWTGSEADGHGAFLARTFGGDRVAWSEIATGTLRDS